jgi:hypothetical protein
MYTTNITGLRNWIRGLSFLNDSAMAGFTNTGSNSVNVVRDMSVFLESVAGAEQHQLFN